MRQLLKATKYFLAVLLILGAFIGLLYLIYQYYPFMFIIIAIMLVIGMIARACWELARETIENENN